MDSIHSATLFDVVLGGENILLELKKSDKVAAVDLPVPAGSSGDLDDSNIDDLANVAEDHEKT